MNTGDLRHRIDVQRATAGSVGPRGGSVRTYATVHESVPALVVQDASDEADERGRLVVNHTYTITIRYLPGLTARDRLVWGDKVLNIEAVIEDVLKVWMTIRAGVQDD